MTISADQIVSAVPSVLSAGGTAASLAGLILTTSTRAPIGAVLSCPNDGISVADAFGLTSPEAALAAVYFLGFDNSTVKPSNLLLAQYPTAPVAAWLRGASLASMPLSTLQAIAGSLTVSLNGVSRTAAIDLTASPSFSSAAATVQTALTTAGFSGVQFIFDSVSQAFQLTNPTTGHTSTVDGYASGTTAAALGLTQTAGAVLSQGADAATPAAFMAKLVMTTSNWACFMTTFEPVLSDKLAFAGWVNSTDDRFAYVCWDTDASPAVGPAPASFGGVLATDDTSGTCLVWKDINTAAFVLGAVASIDHDELEGRITLAFKGQTGLAPVVTDAVTAANLLANGYNYYGVYATAAQTFNFLYNGQVSGPFEWMDSYVDQIWMLGSFKLAIMVAFTQAKSIPYNVAGYALLQAALADPIRQAVTFGAIRAGIQLSTFQAAEVNQAAGAKIDGTIYEQGWYLKIFDATPQTRAARQSPPCKFWYCDGESVQMLNISAIEIQ